MKTRSELKNQALESLRGYWGPAALATFIYFVIAMGAGTPGVFTTSMSVLYSSSIAFSLLVLVPMGLGLYNACKVRAQGGSGEFLGNMFQYGFRNYLHNVAGALLATLYTLLWTLLLIVPGIIKSISYQMTWFILVDEPELSPEHAIQKSMRMMDGHKMEYFLLMLSFIGWFILGMVTLGIGFIWIIPYMYTTAAEFYLELKKETQE